MAIVAYGYGVDSTATGGARLVDFATAIRLDEPVTVRIEEQTTVRVVLPAEVRVESVVPTVRVED